MSGADASGTLVAVVLAGVAAAAAAILLGAGWLRARRGHDGQPAVRRARTRPRADGGTDPVLASLGLDYPDRPRGDDDAGYPGGRSR